VTALRLVSGTLRGAFVALAIALCARGTPGAGAEEPAAPGAAEVVDLPRELGKAARSDLTLAERVAAAKRALSVEQGGDAQAWRRAGVSLLRAAPEQAAWLLRRALREGLDETSLTEVRRLVEQGAPAADAPLADRQRATALAFLLGNRRSVPELQDDKTADPFVRQVVHDEFGQPSASAEALDEESRKRVLWEQLQDLRALMLLDQAAQRDAAESSAALAELATLGADARRVLVHEARRMAEGSPPGLRARGLTALTLLGRLPPPHETETLLACLASSDGWARVAAAAALADLCDPSAAVALARQLAYAGDPFRARESWDYPGTTETTLSPEEWQSVEYYVIDVAAGDALLALGARGAAGWLIRNCLDPTRRNLRIRVAQDALASLRRHLPASAPLPDALADGGLPQRFEAFERLEAWWRAHRHDPELLRARFAEEDPGFVAVADLLAAQLGKPKVLELMIAKDSAELLGAALTPALARAVATTKSKVHKVELATALGRVSDPRAVVPLLVLAADPAGFVRAAAVLALGAYAPRRPEVVDALLARLDDDDCGTRVAALKGLCGAPRDPRVLAALAAHDEAAHAARCGSDSDYAWAARVVRLAQQGSAAWAPVGDGLASPDRVVRRTVWDLLRVSLDLPDHAFDPLPPPDAPGRRGLDDARVKAALAARGLE
jgi:hypothetical protein